MSHTDEQESFYRTLDARRRELRLSWAEVCEQAGLPNGNPITRLGRGQDIMGRNMLKLSAWLHKTKPPGARGCGLQMRA